MHMMIQASSYNDAPKADLYLPFETEEQFLDTEIRTRNDSNVQKCLSDMFDATRQRLLPKFIKQNLAKLMIDELATKCSWYGQNGNIPVKGSLILKLLKESALKKFNLVTEDDVLIMMKKWFQLAKDRRRKRIGPPSRFKRKTTKIQPIRIATYYTKFEPLVIEKVAESFNLKMPFETEEDFMQAEQRTRKEIKLEKFFKESFSQHGYTDLAKFIKVNLRNLVTDKVAKKFSWSSQQGNIAVQGYLIIKLLRDAAAEQFQDATEDELNKAIKKWFQLAKERERKRPAVAEDPLSITPISGGRSPNEKLSIVLPFMKAEEFVEIEHMARTNDNIEKYFVGLR